MQWVVNEKLRKWYGWTHGGLRKMKWGLVVVARTPMARNSEEAVKEMSLRETESEMGKSRNEMDKG